MTDRLEVYRYGLSEGKANEKGLQIDAQVKHMTRRESEHSISFVHVDGSGLYQEPSSSQAYPVDRLRPIPWWCSCYLRCIQ